MGISRVPSSQRDILACPTGGGKDGPTGEKRGARRDGFDAVGPEVVEIFETPDRH